MRNTLDKMNEPDFIYNPNMPDYSKTAFAKRQAEKGGELIAKYGLPKDSKAKKGSKTKKAK